MSSPSTTGQARASRPRSPPGRRARLGRPSLRRSPVPRTAEAMQLADDDRTLARCLAIHGAWKARLANCVAARGVVDVRETLDSAGCELGQWMGAATARLGEDPDFQEAMTWHRRFHAAAAAVAILLEGQRWKEAARRLDGASCQTTSDQLVGALTRLRQRVAKSARGSRLR